MEFFLHTSLFYYLSENSKVQEKDFQELEN